MLKSFLIALPLFVLLDSLWISVIARGYYRSQLGNLLTANVRWTAVVLFYLLFVGGLSLFVLQPALQKQSWQYAAGMGAAFGLVTYATYDLTNLATLRDWPLHMTFVDLLWGTCVCAAVSTITVLLAQRLS